MMRMSRSPSVGIIGAGPGGLALGIFLRKAGFRDFTIFDREDGVGGTWRINTYPGLACDVKSHLYSFSFDKNANWSRLWSGRPRSSPTSNAVRNVIDWVLTSCSTPKSSRHFGTHSRDRGR